MKPVIAAALILLPSILPAAAEDAATLIAQIEAGGRNEFRDERHAVEVEDCQLTTYLWSKIQDGTWLLWTSFKIPMASVDFDENVATDPPIHFFFNAGPPEIAWVTFEARDGTSIPIEKPFERSPKGDYVPSPRGDGTTHYIQEITDGGISHSGPGVIEKARLFTTGYNRYVRQFCTFTG